MEKQLSRRAQRRLRLRVARRLEEAEEQLQLEPFSKATRVQSDSDQDRSDLMEGGELALSAPRNLCSQGEMDSTLTSSNTGAFGSLQSVGET